MWPAAVAASEGSTSHPSSNGRLINFDTATTLETMENDFEQKFEEWLKVCWLL